MKRKSRKLKWSRIHEKTTDTQSPLDFKGRKRIIRFYSYTFLRGIREPFLPCGRHEIVSIANER